MIAMQLDDGGGGSVAPAAIAAPEPAPEPAPTQSLAAIEHAAETAPAADAAKGAAEIVPEPAKEAPLPEAPRPEVIEAPAPAPAEPAAPAQAPEAAPQAEAPAAEAPKADEPKGIEAHAEAPKGDAPKGDAPKGDAPKGVQADAKGDAPEAGAKDGADTSAKGAHGTSHDDGSSKGADNAAEDAGFQGKAADQVKALKAATDKIIQDQAKTDAARKEAASKLEQEQAEAKKTEGEANLQAWNPLNLLAPLVGLEAPKTAWTSHDEHVKAADSSSKDLASAAQEAARLDRNHDRTTESLKDARGVNTLVQTAFATGMGDDVVQHLDSLNGSNLVKEGSTETGGDAEYDSVEKVVNAGSTMDDVAAAAAALKAGNVVTEDGFVTSPNAIRDTEAGKTLISSAALLHHELGHKDQDAAGLFTATDEHVEAMYVAGDQKAVAMQAAGATPAEVDAHLREVDTAAIKTQIENVEFQPNLDQELAEHASGKQAEVHIMLDVDGSQLPKDQQLQNLFDMYVGKPLTFGPNAGVTLTDGTEFASDKDAGYRHPGYRHPGYRHPGYRHP